MGQKGFILRPRCIGPGRTRTQIPFIHSFICLSVTNTKTHTTPCFIP